MRARLNDAVILFTAETAGTVIVRGNGRLCSHVGVHHEGLLPATDPSVWAYFEGSVELSNA